MLVKELIIFMKQRYNDQNLKDAAAAAQCPAQLLLVCTNPNSCSITWKLACSVHSYIFQNNMLLCGFQLF